MRGGCVHPLGGWCRDRARWRIGWIPISIGATGCDDQGGRGAGCGWKNGELDQTAAAGLALALLALVALPAGAQAATLTFANPEGFGPSQGAGTGGPATQYPSSISVSGIAGTVTDVNVTLLAMFANADTDMVLRGPNGQQVLLMSDACIQGTSPRGNWIFDDSAPGFVSRQGPCSPSFPTQVSFRPSNYLGQPNADDISVEPDDLSVAPGGPPPPYVNNLAVLAGGSPNGSWDLFVLDDNAGSFVGFEINSGWALTLEVEPTPPADPPATPSNQFTIGTLDGRMLSVDVASAGTVSIDDAGSKDRLKPTEVAGGPGTVAVEVKLSRAAKRVVRRKGKVKAKTEVTFAPTGGTAATQGTRLKVRG